MTSNSIGQVFLWLAWIPFIAQLGILFCWLFLEREGLLSRQDRTLLKDVSWLLLGTYVAMSILGYVLLFWEAP